MTTEQRRTASSPPCNRDDADTQSRGHVGREEILALCNELLTAERAGAESLGACAMPPRMPSSLNS